MNARDFQTKNVEELKLLLEAEMLGGFKPTLAIIFSSFRDDISKLGIFLKHRGIAMFGASSWGEFTREGVELDSVSALFLDLSTDYFHLQLNTLEGGDEERVAASVARAATERFGNPVFMILISDLETRGEAILKTFEEVLGPDAQVAGAGAGRDSLNSPSFVFNTDTICHRGFLTLIIDGDKVQMTSRAACGWQGIGAPRQITKSKGQWVYEIDGVPALDALLKYIGREDLDLEDQVQSEREINTLPLQLQRPKGDPIMRPALLFDRETRAVMCPGTMEEGAFVRFSIEPDDSVIDVVLEDFRQAKEQAGDLDAVVYFSCWGRYNTLGPAMNREIREAGKLFGVPMVGFLSSGEVARATGGNLEFNALTSCCVLLKEVDG
ncbi:FIST C-terminal domain-containing protein [bacterium]|nr:FIST C-terminal domain-containing protein [bacterium]